ncbi:MAG: glycosyltransferase family 39 protein [Candidatus Pacebacteria bacterium]|nr:glycosyltransferase family 39 protein [Candidatus Paceibacterota bacterium]
MANKKYSLAAGIIIIIASLVALASVWHDAPIVDEDPHIGAGYSYVFGQTYKFNPEHPPLAKDLAGLALLPLGIDSKILSGTYGANWPTDVHGQWNFGRALIYHSGVDPIKIVHAAKIPLILLFILSAVLVFAWAKKTYNSRAALLAVFLFSFSPTIIAHARFVTTDIAALFGVLFSTYFFVKYLKEQSTKNFWLASLSFGVALLAKFSTIILVPYFFCIALLWVWAHHTNFFKPAFKLVLKTALIMLVGFVVVVGPIYQLHVLNYPPKSQQSDATEILTNNNIFLKPLIIWSADKPVLRPYSQYVLGLAMVFQRAEGGNRTYFMGQLSSSSFKSYFPIVFSLKEPIPLLILILLAIWFGFKTWRSRHLSLREKTKEHLPEFIMLLWILIYMAASINANLNIGIRHLMPIYGFIFILVAGQIESAMNRESIKKWFTIFVSIMCLWYVGEFTSVYPYYLTYFNEFAGGPSGGHKYVVDSNLDWGQDLWRLGDFVKENNIQKIYTDYFGWADANFYLGNAYVWMNGGKYTSKESFIKENPQGGWLAISATFYQESSVTPDKPYDWLTQYSPVKVIGNSIFVWHITP